jgi:hypothetical protein
MEINALTLLGIIVAILVVVVAYQTFQLMGMSNRLTGAAVATGSIDMTGWTETEKMNYEHHGIIPARVQQGQQAPQQGVGGC